MAGEQDFRIENRLAYFILGKAGRNERNDVIHKEKTDDYKNDKTKNDDIENRRNIFFQFVFIFLVTDKNGDKRGGEGAGNQYFEYKIRQTERSKKNIELAFIEIAGKRTIT